MGISVIDTNQEPPIFENSRYTFGATEDVTPGFSVGTVTAVSSNRGEGGQGKARDSYKHVKKDSLNKNIRGCERSQLTDLHKAPNTLD